MEPTRVDAVDQARTIVANYLASQTFAALAPRTVCEEFRVAVVSEKSSPIALRNLPAIDRRHVSRRLVALVLCVIFSISVLAWCICAG